MLQSAATASTVEEAKWEAWKGRLAAFSALRTVGTVLRWAKPTVEERREFFDDPTVRVCLRSPTVEKESF